MSVPSSSRAREDFDVLRAISLDSRDEETLSNSQQATQPTQHATARHKASFSQLARDAREKNEEDEEEDKDALVPKRAADFIQEREQQIVLWPPPNASREVPSMSVRYRAGELSERQVDVVRFLHAAYARNASHAGVVVRDDAEADPIVGVCAFLSALVSSRTSVMGNAGVLVLCAPNAILAWTETLKKFGVREVASARGVSKAEEAICRVRGGECSACVLSHDTFRGVLESVMLQRWLAVAYNECHRLKSEKTKAYEAAVLFHKRVFRIGLSDKLFTSLDGLELWSVMNFITPWKLGDKRLYTNYFLNPINNGHRNKHMELAAQRVRELHAHLSVSMTPGITGAALFQQYTPEMDGKDDRPEIAKRALDTLALFEKLSVPEMAKRVLAMDKKARDELRWRVVASELGGGGNGFATTLEDWRNENEGHL